MRTAVLIACCIAALSGCTTPFKHASRPEPVEPFDDDPISFMVIRRFTPGEVAIVRVCVSPDRNIVSASLLESSGDARFDSMAIGWAQSVRLRSVPANGARIEPCGQVRVEIREPTQPRVFSRSDTSLG
jgi:hypothetical protein